MATTDNQEIIDRCIEQVEELERVHGWGLNPKNENMFQTLRKDLIKLKEVQFIEVA